MSFDKDEKAPWKIGVLFSQTGVTAVAERPQLNATLLAIDQINGAGGVAGRPLEPVVYDPASDPKSFRYHAERLLGEDGVTIIAGCYMSSTRKAVVPVAEQYRGLLLYPTLYEGFEYSDHCLYTGAAPNQNIVQLATYLLEHFGDRVYLVGSNYVYPYETNRIMSDLFHSAHGDVVDERYVPLNVTAEACAQIAQDIKRKQPDVVFSTIVGSATSTLYRAYHAAGLDPRKIPIASLTTTESEVQEIGAEAAEGHITAAPYFQTVDSPENRAFLAAYNARFGDDVAATSGAEAAYFQMYLIAEALERAGTDRIEDVLANVYKAEFAAPQGTVRVDPENNHTYLWPRVGRVNAQGQFELVWESGAWVKPDPYLVATAVGEWGAHVAKA
ncbi:MAG: transporter substrate-binding domain-containing protein [Rhodobacterales bacterium]|nr:transporter substrate-binding domain-containing protein [Rhodobacterales bacterium]